MPSDHYLSILDMFSIGIGPSSSHTVGPMRAGAQFVHSLKGLPVKRVYCSLHGSLADTGKGHGTDRAVILGFLGYDPETVPVDAISGYLEQVRESGMIQLPKQNAPILFDVKKDLIFARGKPLPRHPNGMHFVAMDQEGDILKEEIVYSIGGGFILNEKDWEKESKETKEAEIKRIPYPFSNAKELLEQCQKNQCSIADLVLANEEVFTSKGAIFSQLEKVWSAMDACINRGIEETGTLPGGLHVKRRAKSCYDALLKRGKESKSDPLTVLDWVNLYALAVNEENAAGGRVVTAPTNGAAGVLPAVLKYAIEFKTSPYPDGVQRFLLTAGAIATLYKRNASLSGADVGCQGEVGVACSMAAGALTEFLGGSPEQVEFAAEIGMEHNLGLTCDPIGGLVQIPCIERNAMGAVKAINASRLALAAESGHYVSLDKVIQTMVATGRDMKDKYKETARGGLAVNVVEC